MDITFSHQDTPGAKVFDPRDTLVTEDNIEASKARWEAIKAVQAGRATPEQRKLLQDLDAAIARGRS